MLKHPEEVSKIAIKVLKDGNDPVALIIQSEAQKYITNYIKAVSIVQVHGVQVHGVHRDVVQNIYVYQ
jgi:hypothetical protein